MDKPFGRLIDSNLYTFFIGPDKARFEVHSAAIAKQSHALDALINGNMAEAHSKTITWADVDVDTFVRFCEFCYLNDYSPPSCQQASDDDMRDSEIPAIEPEPSGSPIESHTEHKFSGHLVSSSKDKPEIIEKQASSAATPLFSEKDYPLPECCVELRERFAIFSNVSADQDYTPVFLGHARLYVVADKYGIQSLKDLVLCKLYKTLKNFTFFHTRVGDIISLIRYTYNDENTRGGVDGMDGLRRPVTHFVVYWSDCITWRDEFFELLHEGGEFVTDFWKVVRENVDFPIRELP
ncbi:hypothetical protein MGYG_02295 [Nannizzia gypsea CBS 118893]|uniref:BTB domain-containing protein n=1 Tax=Arthroderma gypseum (strain ATCC MYA-4604 / CBS 118893) TaxID=535722 RepID=E4UQV6_ARTGP|nr:hypothetical protein MGYG_02295 [Nannizzia gypsea CBS 118893]EFQ99282.1 hypothetical protein MGYG_02295 [Nannizzia gypsea CBS 118893]